MKMFSYSRLRNCPTIFLAPWILEDMHTRRFVSSFFDVVTVASTLNTFS